LDCVPDIATVFSVKPPTEASGNAQLLTKCTKFPVSAPII